MQPLYNSIGATYGATRCADPAIVQALAQYVGVGRDGSFLDLGCGTGNYTCALAALGGHWHGLDISAEMLKQAKAAGPNVIWHLGSTDELPYAEKSFAGVICTLAIHHFPSLHSSFLEVFRVLDNGPFVVFTAFPEQMRNYWLCHYFPQMMERSIEKMPAKAAVFGALREAGFAIENVVSFHVTNELQDLFLYSGKLRPELYLDAAIRANISSFATLCPAAELEEGLNALRSDIDSGAFSGVVRRYPKIAGDYAYVMATKFAEVER
jgi:ubiquinone/menaquinone biosynthesis C-methylase UbiE